MKNRTLTEYKKILNFYGIMPTPIRIKVLKAIYASPAEFNTQQIREALSGEKPLISQNSIIASLRLFKTRSLLVQIENKEPRDKLGRPLMWFSLSGKHILTIL